MDHLLRLRRTLAKRRHSRPMPGLLESPAEVLAQAPKGFWRLQERLRLFDHFAPAGALTGISDAEIGIASPGELVTLAAIYAEVGRNTSAAHLVERAEKLDPAIYKTRRFLSVTAARAASSPALASLFASDLAALDFVRSHEGTFERLIRENVGSVAVVGNSPCERGSGRGSEIDDHRVVIRFNDFVGSPPFAADYGEKCDVWCRNVFFERIQRRPGFRPPLTLVAGPLIWRIRNGQDLAGDQMRSGLPIDNCPNAVAASLLKELGARPSSGLRILAWIADILGSLKGVDVYGFSLSDQTEGLTHYYQAETRRGPSSHNWIGERRVLDRLLAERGAAA